ncbi:hypothetical protein CDAR_29091 [Caerostris darwini]|uniref:Ycf1 n=1 Tax=Caerostris darwini TaxID=1538125 RepID=A0AAV4VA21_9ARAC|nr:hypothetical protein CDAR_29091 [Caerostris darwini]
MGPVFSHKPNSESQPHFSRNFQWEHKKNKLSERECLSPKDNIDRAIKKRLLFPKCSIRLKEIRFGANSLQFGKVSGVK